MIEEIERIIDSLDGEIGIYYKNIITGETYGHNENEIFVAASVIKIPIMVELFKEINKGSISLEDKVKVKHEDKLPSSGALTYMHDGIEVTIKDLCTLMIILSDNTATNILIKKLGMENINETIKSIGLKNTKINRLLFDSEEQKKGKENYFAPYEIGVLLEQLYKGELISKEISKEMENILKLQKVNHKLPYLLPKNIQIAHKTGEDSGITHDVGIFYSEKPFILCFASNNTNVIKTENAMKEIALMCYNQSILK